MNELIKKHLKNALISIVLLSASFGVSVFLQDVLAVGEHITTVFVFAVFIVSVLTDGYLYGLITAFIGVFAVNFAFTFPYFAFNFTIPENFLSALVMIVISVITSALTTRLKEWQAIRAEGEREKTRANLLRAVSHDLRTPLTTIYGSSSAILENYEMLDEAQKKKMIRGIREDSEWLIRMVENLLSVTKINGGAVKLIKTDTVLEELVDSVIHKLRKRCPETAVSVEIPDELLIIPMDAILIEQVLINLLDNAVRHAVGMKSLILRAHTTYDRAIFEVEDDGCGIDSERVGKILNGESPDTADNHSDSKRGGAGIGLSVCRTIIKAHGGELSAENKRGGGAIFTFSLKTDAIHENTENENDA